jgi:hypothetical protein
VIGYVDRDHRAVVQRYDANKDQWFTVGDENRSDGAVKDISVAYDTSNSGNTYYLAYKDKANKGRATIMQCDELKNRWGAFGQKGFTAGEVNELRMFVDNIYPVIAYIDDGNKKPVVMEYMDKEWVKLQDGEDDLISNGKAYNLAITANRGVRIVAVSDGAYDLKTSVFSFEPPWTPVGGKGFSDGRVNYLDVGSMYNKKTKTNRVFVAFQDFAHKKKLTVMYNDNNAPAWQALGEKGFTEGSPSSISLCVYRNTPFVAFADSAQKGAATVLYYYEDAWQVLGKAGLSETSVTSIHLAILDDTAYIGYITTDMEKRIEVRKIDIKDIFKKTK